MHTLHTRVQSPQFPGVRSRKTTCAFVCRRSLFPAASLSRLPRTSYLTSTLPRRYAWKHRCTLLTSCTDNICRLWQETPVYEPFSVYCAASIAGDSAVLNSVNDTLAPFVLHWLDTKVRLLPCRCCAYAMLLLCWCWTACLVTPVFWMQCAVDPGLANMTCYMCLQSTSFLLLASLPCRVCLRFYLSILSRRLAPSSLISPPLFLFSYFALSRTFTKAHTANT